jgi:hypothetical protein
MADKDTAKDAPAADAAIQTSEQQGDAPPLADAANSEPPSEDAAPAPGDEPDHAGGDAAVEPAQQEGPSDEPEHGPDPSDLDGVDSPSAEEGDPKDALDDDEALGEIVRWRDPDFPDEVKLRAAIVTQVNRDQTVSLNIFYRNHQNTAHDVALGDGLGQFRFI